MIIMEKVFETVMLGQSQCLLRRLGTIAFIDQRLQCKDNIAHDQKTNLWGYMNRKSIEL